MFLRDDLLSGLRVEIHSEENVLRAFLSKGDLLSANESLRKLGVLVKRAREMATAAGKDEAQRELEAAHGAIAEAVHSAARTEALTALLVAGGDLAGRLASGAASGAAGKRVRAQLEFVHARVSAILALESPPHPPVAARFLEACAALDPPVGAANGGGGGGGGARARSRSPSPPPRSLDSHHGAPVLGPGGVHALLERVTAFTRERDSLRELKVAAEAAVRGAVAAVMAPEQLSSLKDACLILRGLFDQEDRGPVPPQAHAHHPQPPSPGNQIQSTPPGKHHNAQTHHQKHHLPAVPSSPLQRAEHLLSALRALQAGQPVERVMETVCEGARALVGADRVAGFVYDEKRGQPVFVTGGHGEAYPGGVYPASIEIARLTMRGGMPVNVDDAYSDPRFRNTLDAATGYRTQVLLSYPLVGLGGLASGCIQVLNRREGDHVPFSAQEEARLGELCAVGGLVVAVSQWQQEREERLVRLERAEAQLSMTDYMLKAATAILSALDLNTVFAKISSLGVGLVRSERCALYLVDHERVEVYTRVLDETSGAYVHHRSPLGEGILAQVIVTKEALNILDAQIDERFNPALDALEGHPATRSVLSMPLVADDDGHVLGVVQLINKKLADEAVGLDPEGFTEDDAVRLRVFAVFCALGVANGLAVERLITTRDSMGGGPGGLAGPRPLFEERLALDPEANPTVASALLGQPQSAPATTTSEGELAKTMDPAFDLAPLSADDLCALAAVWVQQTGLLGSFGIPQGSFLHLTLVCRRACRNLPFHSFRRGVEALRTLLHLAYAGPAPLAASFRSTEMLAMALACLISPMASEQPAAGEHGVPTLLMESSPLRLVTGGTAQGDASLRAVINEYSGARCVILLTRMGVNILETLPDEEAGELIDLVRRRLLDAHLVDLAATHGALAPLLTSGSLDIDLPEHRELLAGVLMATSGLSFATAPWAACRDWAVRASTEFYMQAAVAEEAGLPANPSWSQESRPLAVTHATLAGEVVEPLMAMVKSFCPAAETLHRRVTHNLISWKVLPDTLTLHDLAAQGAEDAMMESKESSASFHADRRPRPKPLAISVHVPSGSGSSTPTASFPIGRSLSHVANPNSRGAPWISRSVSHHHHGRPSPTSAGNLVTATGDGESFDLADLHNEKEQGFVRTTEDTEEEDGDEDDDEEEDGEEGDEEGDEEGEDHDDDDNDDDDDDDDDDDEDEEGGDDSAIFL
jgi:GAF domain-containing protein